MNTQEKFNLWVKMKITEAQHNRAYHEYMNALNGTDRTDLVDETIVSESVYRIILNKNIDQIRQLCCCYQNQEDSYYENNDFIQGKRAAEKAMIVRFAIREYNAIEETEKYYEAN